MELASSGQRLLGVASGNSLGAYPSLGMSMRFAVRVFGLGSPSNNEASADLDLGLWQSCRSLELDLSYKSVTQGGGYLVDSWLPEKLTYPPVTLERPMERSSSKKVQAWLERQISSWGTYAGEDYGVPPSTSVEITLLDCQLNEVMKWELRHARPLKWTGPSLNATDNKVAVESLSIAHSGFIDAAMSGLAGKARLLPGKNAKGSPIIFDFNPNVLTLSHSSKTRNAAKTGKKVVSTLSDLGLPSLSLPKLTIDGKKTLTYCEQLLTWSFPVDPADDGTSDKPSLPNLVFEWGLFEAREMRQIEVTLTKVDITYERFDSKARPTRATVSLDLELIGSSAAEPEQQNPTSGGLPGRAGRRMVCGETLAGIALDRYGDPAAWRPLAVVNGIDDPLRMRPGSSVYLPDRNELAP